METSMTLTAISPQQAADDYARIEQAIRYLEARFRQQPELGQVAASVGLSEYHFQRLFTRWVGISPKRFLQYLTKEYAKQLLEDSDLTITQIAARLKYSQLNNFTRLFKRIVGMPPSEYREKLGQAITETVGQPARQDETNGDDGEPEQTD